MRFPNTPSSVRHLQFAAMDDRSPPMPGTRSTLARTARTNNTSAKINPAHTAMRRARNTRRISSPRNRCNFNHSQQRHRSSRAAPRKREHKGTLFAGVSPCIVSRQPWGRATRVASREPATAHAVRAKITRRRTRTATRRRWRPQSERRPESTPLPNARHPCSESAGWRAADAA